MDELSYHRLTELTANSERAYRRAQVDVFNQVSFAAMLDPSQLTPSQQDAIDELLTAEAALAEFRKGLRTTVR